MRFHHNTEPAETIAYLRDQAIQAKQPPAVIDSLDALGDLLDLEGDIEKANEDCGKAETDKNDLFDELETLVEHMQTAVDTIASIHKSPADAAEMIDLDELRELQRYLGFAEKALERHKA